MTVTFSIGDRVLRVEHAVFARLLDRGAVADDGDRTVDLDVAPARRALERLRNVDRLFADRQLVGRARGEHDDVAVVHALEHAPQRRRGTVVGGVRDVDGVSRGGPCGQDEGTDGASERQRERSNRRERAWKARARVGVMFRAFRGRSRSAWRDRVAGQYIDSGVAPLDGRGRPLGWEGWEGSAAGGPHHRPAQRHEVAAVAAVDVADGGLVGLVRRAARAASRAAMRSLERSSSASSSRILRTPARLTPSLVSSWMRRSSAMSRSE